ncbi:clostripain-related cysteine peptidase [Hyalangium gracile]|uniref:clostripain-related cysteine peptidase n=1 Tax=Hyalangium gracile TaxID=394092 RepID=UPI001CCAB785|nr:clostripain-related cysteine peptidase [Hyalangium gracile]
MQRQRRLSRYAWALALALVAVSSAACGGEDPDDGPEPGPIGTPDGGSGNPDGGTNPTDPNGNPSNGTSWTVLVYMNADNDLEPFALQDLNEMMQVGSGPNFNIIVEVDRSPRYATGGVGGLPDFSDTKRIKVLPGSIQVLQEMGEVDLAAPQALSDFVTWGMQNFPADRTAILFWDHGSGWTGFGVDETTGAGQLLTLPEIEQGLRTSLGSKRVALLGFDACLMANYETALTLAPFGHYLLASEEVEPGHGWDWRSFSVARQNPGADPIALGNSIIQGFRAQANQTPSGDAAITLSLVDLNALSGLETAVKSFTDVVAAGGEARISAVGRAREGTRSYQSGSGDPTQDLHLYDLRDLVTKAAAADTALSSSAAQVQQAIGQVVKANFAGTARAGSFGLTVFFPPGATFVSPEYGQLTRAAAWRSFLQGTFTNAVSVPTFAAPKGIKWSGTTESVRISSTLATGAAASIARATLFYGLQLGSSYFLLGDEPAEVSATEAVGSWDRSLLVVSQGTNEAYAYSNIEYGSDYASLNIDFAYRASASAPVQLCIRQMVFQATSAGLVKVVDRYYLRNGNAWGELSPQPGSTLNPIVRQLFVDSQGNTTSQYVYSAQTPFVATAAGDGSMVFNMNLQFRAIAKGTPVVVALDVRNASNAGDFVIGAGSLP